MIFMIRVNTKVLFSTHHRVYRETQTLLYRRVGKNITAGLENIVQRILQ